MEQSYVKLKIAEKEDRLRKEKEKKAMTPANGTAQKDGKYFLVRLDMEVQKINGLIDAAEKESRLSQLPEEGMYLLYIICCLLQKFDSLSETFFWLLGLSLFLNYCFIFLCQSL